MAGLPKPIFVETSCGWLALRSAGSGGQTLILCIHGNSSSSKIFCHVLQDKKIISTHCMLSLDLPGHGQSENATKPENTYTMPGYAKAAVEVLEKFGIKEVVVVGWSLGGHIGTEMLPLFPGTKGLMMIGSLLVGLYDAPLDDDRTRWNMREDLTADDLTMFAELGTGGPFEQWMADASIRTDGKARRVLFQNLGFGDCSNQQQLIAETKVPTAVVIGTDEPHLDNDMIKGLKYGNLWGGKCVEIAGCEHCPLWEKPDEFLPVLGKFLADISA